MPLLAEKWFRNPTNIPLATARALAAGGYGAALSTTLRRCGWQSNRGAGIVAELSPDNKHVARAQFFIQGILSEQPGTVAANKLWERADKAVNLSITFPPGDAFSFASGTLASEYLHSDEVKIACSKNGAVVLPTDYDAHGIGDFSLRLVAYLDRTSNGAQGPRAKYTVLGFPASEDSMRDTSDLAVDVGWPGVKLLEGTADFTPLPAQEGWGCPFLPILMPGADLDTAPNVPSGAELRFAMAKVMATARLATPCTSAASMSKKWQKLVQDPNSLEDRLPSISWPEPVDPPPADQGRNSYIKGRREKGRFC